MPLCPRFYREMQTSRLQVEEQFGFSAMPFLGRTAVTIQGQSPAVDVDDQHKLIMTHCAASPTATAKGAPPCPTATLACSQFRNARLLLHLWDHHPSRCDPRQQPCRWCSSSPGRTSSLTSVCALHLAPVHNPQHSLCSTLSRHSLRTSCLFDSLHRFDCCLKTDPSCDTNLHPLLS